MSSRAARRKAKKARITLPGGDVVPSRPVGRDRRHTNQPDDTPPPIHAARARRCSLDSTSPLHESDMGRCILALSEGQERADLADAWASISTARRNYRMRYIGQTGEPQGAATPMLHDRMETDQSLRVDLRTPTERDDAAKRAWRDWQSMINELPLPQMRWALTGALDGFMGEASLWRDGKPTTSGRAAVQALKLLIERG